MKISLCGAAILRLLAAIALCGFASSAQAAKIYVDKTLGDVKAEDQVKVTTPQSVQFAFEFQTDGVRNLKAEKYAKPLVIADVETSGLFTDLTDAPVPTGALLTIVINNLTEKDAAKKGFKAGLTFGLSGVAVTDRYDVTFDYQRSGLTPGISAIVKHAIHLTIGKKEDPAVGTPVKNFNLAFDMVAKQAVAHGMNRIAADPRFATN